MDTFTDSQKSDIVQKGAVAQTQLGIGKSIIDVLAAVGDSLTNNLIGITQELVDLAKKMFDNKKTKKQYLVSGWKKLKKFCTAAKFKELMCNVRTPFSDKEWKVIYNNFKDVFKFDNFNCTKI